jgi:hypothetical protein
MFKKFFSFFVSATLLISATLIVPLVQKNQPNVNAAGINAASVSWQGEEPGFLRITVKNLGSNHCAPVAWKLDAHGQRSSIINIKGGSQSDATEIYSSGSPTTGGRSGDGDINLSYNPKLALPYGIEVALICSYNESSSVYAQDTKSVIDGLTQVYRSTSSISFPTDLTGLFQWDSTFKSADPVTDAQQKGYEEGYQKGHQTAWSEAHKTGWETGRESGYKEGHQTAWSEAHQTGWKTGWEEGKKAGGLATAEKWAEEYVPQLGDRLTVAWNPTTEESRVVGPPTQTEEPQALRSKMERGTSRFPDATRGDPENVIPRSSPESTDPQELTATDEDIPTEHLKEGWEEAETFNQIKPYLPERLPEGNFISYCRGFQSGWDKLALACTSPSKIYKYTNLAAFLEKCQQKIIEKKERKIFSEQEEQKQAYLSGFKEGCRLCGINMLIEFKSRKIDTENMVKFFHNFYFHAKPFDSRRNQQLHIPDTENMVKFFHTLNPFHFQTEQQPLAPAQPPAITAEPPEPPSEQLKPGWDKVGQFQTYKQLAPYLPKHSLCTANPEAYIHGLYMGWYSPSTIKDGGTWKSRTEKMPANSEILKGIAYFHTDPDEKYKASYLAGFKEGWKISAEKSKKFFAEDEVPAHHKLTSFSSFKNPFILLLCSSLSDTVPQPQPATALPKLLPTFPKIYRPPTAPAPTLPATLTSTPPPATYTPPAAMPPRPSKILTLPKEAAKQVSLKPGVDLSSLCSTYLTTDVQNKNIGSYHITPPSLICSEPAYSRDGGIITASWQFDSAITKQQLLLNAPVCTAKNITSQEGINPLGTRQFEYTPAESKGIFSWQFVCSPQEPLILTFSDNSGNIRSISTGYEPTVEQEIDQTIPEYQGMWIVRRDPETKKAVWGFAIKGSEHVTSQVTFNRIDGSEHHTFQNLACRAYFEETDFDGKFWRAVVVMTNNVTGKVATRERIVDLRHG